MRLPRFALATLLALTCSTAWPQARGTQAAPSPTNSTPSAAELAGHYYLEGVREVGSELLLRPDGRFEWTMSYGAVDQYAQGRWQQQGQQLVLTAARPTEAPVYRLFKEDELRLRKAADPGRWVAIVGVPRVGPTAGVEVWFEGSGGKLGRAVSQPNGDAILERAPQGQTWVRAGLRRANSQDTWQWLSIPAARAQDRIAAFAVDDPAKLIEPAFERMVFEVSPEGLTAQHPSGQALRYRRQ
jgi:hypothetical protein